MSKKKSRKKQQFKYGQSGASQNISQATTEMGAGVVTAKVPSKQQQALAGVDDFSYVRSDLMRVAVFAAICIGLELAVWIAFNKTGLGVKAYSLFKL